MFDTLNCGTRIKLSFIEYALDDGFIEDDRFLYALCGYIQVEKGDETILKLVSNETELGFSLDLIGISLDQFQQETRDLSPTMRHTVYKSIDFRRIASKNLVHDATDIQSLTIKFDDNELIHIVSGEYYLSNGKGCVSVCDEMLLVFDDLSVSQKLLS